LSPSYPRRLACGKLYRWPGGGQPSEDGCGHRRGACQGCAFCPGIGSVRRWLTRVRLTPPQRRLVQMHVRFRQLRTFCRMRLRRSWGQERQIRSVCNISASPPTARQRARLALLLWAQFQTHALQQIGPAELHRWQFHWRLPISRVAIQSPRRRWRAVWAER
jgi:hypothetical protein